MSGASSIAGAARVQPRQRGRVLGRRQGRPAGHRARTGVTSSSRSTRSSSPTAVFETSAASHHSLARLLPVVRHVHRVPGRRRADEPLTYPRDDHRLGGRCPGALGLGVRRRSAARCATARRALAAQALHAQVDAVIVAVVILVAVLFVVVARQGLQAARAGLCRQGASDRGRRRSEVSMLHAHGPRPIPTVLGAERQSVPADLGRRFARAAATRGAKGLVASAEAKIPPSARASRRGATSTCPTCSRPPTSPSTTGATSGCPGEYPFTRGVQPTMYRGRALDDAHVRGLRHARADERALQVPARAGADGPLDRLRFPDPHGLRLRLARARSARSACAASPSTRCATWRCSSTDIPLDQVTTSMTINGPAIVLLAFYVALADKRGIPRDRHRRHRAERLPEGVHRAARVARPAAPGDAHRHRHDRVLRRARSRAGTPSASAATTSARPGATAAQELAFTLADGIGYVRGVRRRAGSTSTTSRRASRSSSTCTTTSSRRSPSSAPRGASGRAS